MESEWNPHATKSVVIARSGARPDRPDYSRKPNPSPIPGRLKSLVQLRSWASQRFPRATLVTEGLDLKAWNRIALILEDLASDWSGVAQDLGWITTRHALWEDDARGTIAAAESISGEKIAFNPYYFASPRRITKAARKGDRAGIYPRGAGDARERYFISHEWGHLVLAWLRRHDHGRYRRLAALFLNEPDNLGSPVDSDKVAAISDYATRGLTEAFAEAFGVIQWQRQGLWPEVVHEFARILRGEP